MHLALLLLLTLCGIASSAGAQTGDSTFYSRFFQALLNDSSSLSGYVLPEELALSQRLGIRYEGVKNKFTVSFDFDDDLKRDIRSGVHNAVVKVETLSAGATKMSVGIEGKGLKKFFYFNNRKLVSPVYYYARQWTRWESKHFQIWISDTTQFHREALTQLEKFLAQAAVWLRLSTSDLKTIQSKKLIYVLCRDEDEIERLTGYRTRGMFLVPYDYVVTTYSCHFHELLHQLINFKLRSLPLYTHPILQEGFAAAFGGRGGIAPQTVLQSGVFLLKAGVADLRELFSASEFMTQDASMTYPLSGLYVRFLFDRLGSQRFLRLYRDYSGTADMMKKMVLSTAGLPSEKQWQAFLDSVSTHPAIRFDGPASASLPIAQGDEEKISETREYYAVEMKRDFGMVPLAISSSYRSVKFKEVLPNESYHGERYLFTADSNEVVIYDLFTNNSVAAYSSGFSWPSRSVPHDLGVYKFWVRKDLFAVPLHGMQMVHEVKGEVH